MHYNAETLVFKHDWKSSALCDGILKNINVIDITSEMT